ncbi:hypothetical protein DPMN_099295 [Dreissena polymorpha]|uniref:Uncharacterized protein n=1 Tax=Dreissena polymorpha TaxID=45954 RepID=A0A9D4LDM9_DREPO|nr:hypothetical protein DPMN_099295 [Dreissena polymorpha]
MWSVQSRLQSLGLRQLHLTRASLKLSRFQLSLTDTKTLLYPNQHLQVLRPYYTPTSTYRCHCSCHDNDQLEVMSLAELKRKKIMLENRLLKKATITIHV